MENASVRSAVSSRSQHAQYGACSVAVTHVLLSKSSGRAALPAALPPAINELRLNLSFARFKSADTVPRLAWYVRICSKHAGRQAGGPCCVSSKPEQRWQRRQVNSGSARPYADDAGRACPILERPTAAWLTVPKTPQTFDPSSRRVTSDNPRASISMSCSCENGNCSAQ